MTLVDRLSATPLASNGPVRVMHVVHCLGSDGRTGGMEYGVIKLANRLDRSRVQTAICSTRPADPDIVGLLDSAVPHYSCTGRRQGNDPFLVGSLFRTFRRARPHVVHTHSWGTLLEGLLAARLARVPVVIHGEHGTLQTRSGQLLAQRAAWAHVDQVLSVSSVLADRMATVVGFPRERIRVIRNGVDTERFGSHPRRDARRALGFADNEILVGTVGRLVDVKDHPTLITAFSRVAREHPEAVLVMAGDGPLAATLADQARQLGIGARVRFLGHRPDIERVLAALDIFVLSSVSEGLSNTIQEAMASGVPVVATRVGGAEELVIDAETGVLVPARDAGALAAALAPLLASPERRIRMGMTSYRRARAEFAVQRMVSEYERLYGEVTMALIRQHPASSVGSASAHS